MPRIPNFGMERKLGRIVAGVDEVGIGPWAGPVVAAAVILDEDNIPKGIDDSKKLVAARREELFHMISMFARVGVGMASVQEIDGMNILKASHLAMLRAINALNVIPEAILVDGVHVPQVPMQAQAVVDGDSKCLSIAAASVIAKVTRDRLMRELAARHPHYGWERNAGYGTRQHQAAIARHGITPEHRTSFAPIRRFMEGVYVGVRTEEPA
jgi:ribonuclease HII